MALTLTLLILLVTMGLFLTGWLSLDLIALLMLLALMLTGIITPAEAFAGFSDQIVIMIVALFVIGGAIQKSGVAQLLGQQISKLTQNRAQPALMVMLIMVALLSSVMSTTGTAAIFMPIAIQLAQQTGRHPARFLLPMSFAALIGGMLTLIATPPNLVVSNLLEQAGLQGFGFFDFTLPGLIALLIFLGYMLGPGQWLLPAYPIQEDLAINRPQDFSHYPLHANWLALPDQGDFVIQNLAELNWPKAFGVQILACIEPGRIAKTRFCKAETQLKAGMWILVLATPEQLQHFNQTIGSRVLSVSELPAKLVSEVPMAQLGLAEILILPQSTLIGKSLKELQFRQRFQLHVVAIQRGQHVVTDLQEPLRFADLLLVQGPPKHLDRLRIETRDFTLLNPEQKSLSPAVTQGKLNTTLLLVLGMVLCLITGFLPAVTVILLTAVLLVLTRCVSMVEAYRLISWESVVLIAAMLPMATALTKTGGTEALSHWLAQQMIGLGPYLILSILFVLISGCGLFISNTATAVLLGPVALQLALKLGYSPQAFMMVVAMASSAAFSTPISSPANTLVLGPGEYRFIDYLKLGLPLQFILMLVCLLVVPLLFGLQTAP